MSRILKRIVSFIRFDGKRRARRQGGYVVIALAAIGLFGGIAAAAPVLNRAIGSLKANDASPAEQSGARSAAEHAMWRLQNEPELWSSMTGEPPSTDYTFSVLGSSTDADIDIVALSAPPANPFRINFEVTPDSVAANSLEEVTFTLTVINDDIEAHEIDRVTMFTSGWLARPVSGEVSGMTTSYPDRDGLGCYTFFYQQDCKYTWNFVPVEVPPFGGEVNLTWTAEVYRSGTRVMPGEIHVINEGTFSVPSARLTFGSDSGLVVEEFVTPNERSAGVNTVYDYTLRVTNNSGDTLHIDWLRHWSPVDLEYVENSSAIDGTPVADPGDVQGGLFYQLAEFLGYLFSYDKRDRYLWDLPQTEIQPGEHVDLTFQMEGGLDPGIYLSRGSVLVDEAPGGDFLGLLDLSTKSSGDTAQITISQGFTVTAEHEGHTVVVSGYIMPDGIDILSWKEY